MRINKKIVKSKGIKRELDWAFEKELIELVEKYIGKSDKNIVYQSIVIEASAQTIPNIKIEVLVLPGNKGKEVS